VFRDVGAIEPLKRLASGVVQQAARFAAQALRLIGEEVPLRLSPQVPLWTSHDVIRWMQQVTAQLIYRVQPRTSCCVYRSTVVDSIMASTIVKDIIWNKNIKTTE